MREDSQGWSTDAGMAALLRVAGKSLSNRFGDVHANVVDRVLITDRSDRTTALSREQKKFP